MQVAGLLFEPRMGGSEGMQTLWGVPCSEGNEKQSAGGGSRPAQRSILGSEAESHVPPFKWEGKRGREGEGEKYRLS